MTDFQILFDDGAVVVVVKPRGTDCERDLPAMIGGDVFLVHRLDRETAGLLVAARTPHVPRILHFEWAFDKADPLADVRRELAFFQEKLP